MARKVAVLVGSLRKGSFTRKVAAAIAELAPKELAFEPLEIDDLPLYNQDVDTTTPPEPWQRLRERVRACDAVLFATPEYNRSVPGVVKNAIDVGSRPYGKSAWAGKPAAIVSVAPGHVGAFGANHHLRQMLVFLDMPALQQPEMYVSGADKLFDAAGKLASDTTRQLFVKFGAAFARWIERTAPARER